MQTYKDKYIKYKLKYLTLKKHLTSKYNQTGGSNKKTLTLIKAEWCGHCKQFKPIWDDLASKIKYINFKVLDSELNKDSIEKYNISGYPSIFLEDNNNIKEYTGSRTIESIKNFVKEN